MGTTRQGLTRVSGVGDHGKFTFRRGPGGALRVLSVWRHPVGPLRERVVEHHLSAGHAVLQRRVPHPGPRGGQVSRGVPGPRHSVRSIIELDGRGLSSVAPPAPEGVPATRFRFALLPLHPAFIETGRLPWEEPALKNLRSPRVAPRTLYKSQ